MSQPLHTFVFHLLRATPAEELVLHSRFCNFRAHWVPGRQAAQNREVSRGAAALGSTHGCPFEH
jgi:hypothetical protein